MSDFDPYGPSKPDVEPDEADFCPLCDDYHGGSAYRCQVGDLGSRRCARRPRHRKQHCDGERRWSTPAGGPIGAAMDKLMPPKKRPGPPPAPGDPVVSGEGAPTPTALMPAGMPSSASPIDGLRPEEPASVNCTGAHEHPFNIYDHCGKPVGKSICTRRGGHEDACCSGSSGGAK